MNARGLQADRGLSTARKTWICASRLAIRAHERSRERRRGPIPAYPDHLCDADGNTRGTVHLGEGGSRCGDGGGASCSGTATLIDDGFWVSRTRSAKGATQAGLHLLRKQGRTLLRTWSHGFRLADALPVQGLALFAESTQAFRRLKPSQTSAQASRVPT